MIKVTLDTNVLISATFWTGDSFKIVDKIDKKKIICILSKEILLEYNKIMNSDEMIEKIKEKDLIISRVIQKMIINSKIVEPITKLDIIKEDKSDNKILECAKTGNVDYIITKDNHLLKLKEFEGIKIVTPREFNEVHDKNSQTKKF